MHIFQAAPIGKLPVEIPFQKRLNDLAVRVGPPQEGNVQKNEFHLRNCRPSISK